jgi:hypothetical protein
MYGTIRFLESVHSPAYMNTKILNTISWRQILFVIIEFVKPWTMRKVQIEMMLNPEIQLIDMIIIVPPHKLSYVYKNAKITYSIASYMVLA